MKKEYCEIELEIIKLTLRDVLTTSKPEGGMGDAWGDGDDWLDDDWEAPTEDDVPEYGGDFDDGDFFD